MKKTKAEYWAPKIHAEWRKSVEGILGVGRQLIAAKKSCEHGEFLRLFKGHDNAVSDPVPFDRTSGFRLMEIAENKVLANDAHGQHLPQSWRTLYELTKLEDEQIIAGIKAGEITADMTRADAAALRSDAVEHPERELCVLAWEALSGAYAKYADKLGEHDRLFVLERLESLVRLIKQEASPDASRRKRGGLPKAANAAG
jgi:hypothetical protein